LSSHAISCFIISAVMKMMLQLWATIFAKIYTLNHSHTINVVSGYFNIVLVIIIHFL